MAGTSKNRYDVYHWIIKVINSCENYRQVLSTNKLIRNFSALYDDVYLSKTLRYLSDAKMNSLGENE